MRIAAHGLTDDQARTAASASSLTIGGLTSTEHHSTAIITDPGHVWGDPSEYQDAHVMGHADIVRESVEGATFFPLRSAVEGWAPTPGCSRGNPRSPQPDKEASTHPLETPSRTKKAPTYAKEAPSRRKETPSHPK